MMLHSLLRRDQKGIGAVEFALVAPAFIAMIVGVSQMGKLFFANADMKNAVAAGARVASTWTLPDGVPSDATILAAVNGRLAASTASARATPSVVRGVDSNGNPFVEVRMAYTVPLEFIFFDMAPITLTDTRRVFTQVTNANQTSYTTTTGSTGGTTSSTTTGGTTSATSAGGTTSATSASSTGGTSATSASSTSTSATSASSTSSGDNGSSGSNNGSSGSNNGSSGHSHGNCNKKC